MLCIDRENGYYVDFLDKNSVALVKKLKGKDDKEVLQNCGYYGNLTHVLHGYVSAIGKEPAGSMKEIIDRLKHVQEMIGNIDGKTKEDFRELMVEAGKKRKEKSAGEV